MPSAGMKTNDLNRIISAVKNFAAKDEQRNIYQYIRIEFSAADSRATAIAVDGCRLSVEHAMCFDCEEDFAIYIRGNIRLPAKKVATFELKDGECIIRCEDYIFGYRQPEGEFLDWEKVIPKNDPIFKIGFNGDFLLTALQSAKKSVGDVFKGPVILEFHGEMAPIVLRTNVDDVKFVLPVRVKGGVGE